MITFLSILGILTFLILTAIGFLLVLICSQPSMAEKKANLDSGYRWDRRKRMFVEIESFHKEE